MSKIRVLVFPCGSEIALEIYSALRFSVHVELYGASSREDNGRLVFAQYRSLPVIVDEQFDVCFSELLQQWQIDLVFATHDSVHAYLAKKMEVEGARLVNGDPFSAQLGRSKSLTYQCFFDQAWVPRVYPQEEAVDHWPVVVKPDQGQGGQGVRLVHTTAQLAAALEVTSEPLICEYLPGEEVTVDCFTDRHGCLIFLGPRSRERIVGGVAMSSRRLCADEQCREIGEAINKRLILRGPWFFQLKRDARGQWKLLEMSCRLSSSSVLQRAAGVNLALLAVQDHMGRDLTIVADSRVSRVERRLATSVVLDYCFDTACFDLDDTLLMSDRTANPAAMRLVYRMLQLGKRLLLLTRHPADPRLALEAAHIPVSLFARIVHLRHGEPKSQYIPQSAIFIDNYFPERLEVHHALGIPVFDVDALEILF